MTTVAITNYGLSPFMVDLLGLQPADKTTRSYVVAASQWAASSGNYNVIAKFGIYLTEDAVARPGSEVVTTTATIAATSHIVFIDAVATNYTVTLPLLSSVNVGHTLYIVFRTNTSAVITIDGNGTERVLGALNYRLTAAGQVLRIKKQNSTNWTFIGSWGKTAPYPLIYDAAIDANRAVNVLVLDDRPAANTDSTGDLMRPLLTAQGFNVTDGLEYYNYVGTDFSAYDCVLWLEGHNYGNALEPGVDKALRDYVRAGGGLIRMGWGLWYEVFRRNTNNNVNPICADLMPVSLPKNVDINDIYSTAAGTFRILDVSNNAARAVPTTPVATLGGYNIFPLRPNSKMIAASRDARAVNQTVPILSYTRQFGGISVWLADAGRSQFLLPPRPGAAGTMEADVQKLYFNAVWVAAQKVSPGTP